MSSSTSSSPSPSGQHSPSSPSPVRARPASRSSGAMAASPILPSPATSSPSPPPTATETTSAKTVISPLDPRSSVFTPSQRSPLDKPIAHTPYHTTNPTQGTRTPTGASTSTYPLHHSRSSLTLSTPESKTSAYPLTPSSGMTWASGPVSPTTLYTPPFKHDGDVFASTTDFSTKRKGLVTDDNIGRFLMITGLPTTVDGRQVQQMIKAVAAFKAIIVSHLKTKGWVIIAFFDPREAFKVYKKFTTSLVRFEGIEQLVQLRCDNVNDDVVLEITGTGDEWEAVWTYSQSTLEIKVVSPIPVGFDNMQHYAGKFGEIKSFEAGTGQGESYIVDYYDTRTAAEVQRYLDNQPWDGGVLRASFIAEDVFNSEPLPGTRYQAPQSNYTLGSAAFNSSAFDHLDTLPSLGPQTPTRRASFGGVHQRFSSLDDGRPKLAARNSLGNEWPRISPPSSRPSGSYDAPPHMNRNLTEPAALQDLLNRMDISARVRQQQQSVPLSPVPLVDRQAIPPENRVYPERVLAGLDLRTTVMVKDVPNKLSRQELVNILQETVPGEFDFVYLRFDFNNHCNVGYAFVNFTSTRALYTFYQARVGKKWNMFSSEKVLQVSYANYQGKVALVNKFRNSAVMNVIEEWRPQIFYSSGVLKGQPEPFPDPDSPSPRDRQTAARLSFLSGAAPDSFGGPEYDYPSRPSYGF